MQSLGSKKSSRFHRELIERSCKYLSCSSVIHIHHHSSTPKDSWPEYDQLLLQLRGWRINSLHERWKAGREGVLCMSRWNVLEFRLGTEKTYHVASCHTISHPKVTERERFLKREAREVFSWRNNKNNYVCWCEFSFLCLPILVVQLRTCHKQGRIHLRLPGQLWRLVEGLTDRVWRSWDIMTQCGTTCEDCRGNVFRGNVCGTL